jgi:putative MATE family efflux protein
MADQPIAIDKSIPIEEQPGGSDLLGMPIRRALFTLAWPTVLAVLLEHAATTVDMIMVGRLGAAEIASVGFSSMINWTLTAMVMGLSIAVTAIVARYIGAGRPEEVSRSLGQSIILALVLSTALSLLIFITAPVILGLFGLEQDVFQLSLPYLRILCFGTIFLSVMSVSSGALRGAGDTRTPMYIGAVATIIHIAINYFLIFGKGGAPNLGIRGAAIGTLVSQLIAAIIYGYLLFSARLRISVALNDFKWDSKRAWQVVRLAVPASSEQVVLEVGLLIYARFIVAFGTIALSGYQVGMQVLSLSFIPNGGISMSAATLIGQNLGAGRKKDAKKAGWICVFWGVIAMCSLGVLYLIIPRQLASIFVNDPEVIELAASFIRVVGIAQAMMATYFTLSGALRGAGDTRTPLLVTFLGMYGFRIPAAWIATRYLGMGVQVAFSFLIFDYVVRLVVILIRYQRGKWLDTKV